MGAFNRGYALIILTAYRIGDDEYDYHKAAIGRAMKERMGIGKNPLDGARARVGFALSSFYADTLIFLYLDGQITIHVPILPQSRVHTVPDTGRQDRKGFLVVLTRILTPLLLD